jgi:DNA-binding IclR family transcriptional regulator
MRALERITAVLEAIAQGSPVPATTIAERAGLTLSTTVRLLASLVDEDLVRREQDRYLLSFRLLAIAHAAERQSPLIASAIPLMERLRDATGETVSLHVASGTNRVCTAEVQSRHEVRRVLPPGQTMPLNFGTVGDVLLASLPEEARHRRLADLGATPDQIEESDKHCREINELGYALAVDRWVDGVSGIAAPVKDRSGATVAALIASGPSQRWTEATMREHVAEILAVAEEIGLRGVPPAD